MVLLHIVFAMSVHAAPMQVKDSTLMTLRAANDAGVSMTWVALDSTRHVVNQGTTPATLKVPPTGPALIYCVERGTGDLEVVLRNRDYQITATARCTKVTVRGLAIRTEAMRDPRAIGGK